PGLYVHVPFCRGKCPYCGFHSCTDLTLIPAWLAALEAEAGLYREVFPSFDTLYLGGGTPSLLTLPALERLLTLLRRLFAFAPESELTLEANPDDLTPEKLRGYRELGITRLSLGVQSLEEQELKFLKRRHTAAQAEAALSAALAAGLPAVAVDLIYGLPGQSLLTWEKTLTRILAYRPQHLSCYQLTAEAGTPLMARLEKGEVALPGEEDGLAFFLFTSEFLTDQGYLHYEVSNYARGEKNFSRHNRKYWQHVPYLGLGPAAHSFAGGQRWWNHADLTIYLEALVRGEAPVAGRETLTPEQLRLEALLLGFRTRFGVEVTLLQAGENWRENLARLQETGLVELSDGLVIPTREGLAVADRLPELFL
ncbi:MAG: radical SAM family heme chaperone HemW, partial [Desulfobaccales bacterium]